MFAPDPSNGAALSRKGRQHGRGGTQVGWQAAKGRIRRHRRPERSESLYVVGLAPNGWFRCTWPHLFRPHHRVSWLCSSVCADIHCLSREAQREIRAERPRTVQLQHTIPKPDDSSSSAYSLPSSRESLTLSTTCESWGNGWQVHFLPMKRKRRAHYWEVLVKVSDRL